MKEAANLNIELDPVPKNGTVFGRASDFVKTDKKLRPLADYLLGNLLVVENLQDALNDTDLSGWGLVDTAGSYAGNDLILKNRQISEHGNFIGRQGKLDRITSELDQLTEKETVLSKKIKSLNISIQAIQKDIEDHLKTVEELTQYISRLENKLMRNRLGQSQVLDTIQSLQLELTETETIVQETYQSLQSLKPIIDKADKELLVFQGKINAANTTMLEVRKTRDDQQEVIQNARITLINLESRRDNLRFKISAGKETGKALKVQQKAIFQEISDLQDAKTNLEQQVETGEKELETLMAEIQRQRSIIDLKQSVYSETYRAINEIQTRITTDQQDRERLLENLKNTELEMAETEQKIKIVKERVQDRYSINVPSNLTVEESDEELSFKISKIQKGLENIGPVNMAVQDEYNEQFERLEHLQKQQDDLIAAEENLRETIRKIDRVARKRFQETFELIRGNFGKLFNQFFEGGVASLRLIGDPDPLEADIHIEAQPPGKRNTSLRLLSSGEKALTAISLLFSIYQVKPSPYCILDEVDAPLDDVNIHKFTNVLRKFADETQFIIVTHNKLTMEIANQMYGVTQEKKGISKLVSVKFD